MKTNVLYFNSIKFSGSLFESFFGLKMKGSNIQENTYSLNDTNIAKGIAVILLLTHHLFYDKPFLGPFVGDFSIVYFIAQISKVCVGIFIFLSGYGLSKSWKNESIGFFLKKRLTKFFLNYWVIWLLFVPIGIFVFGRSFDIVYSDHVFIKFILNFFGLHMFFKFYGYNPTWWFASLILFLYLIFPFLKAITDKHGLLGVFITFLFLFIQIDIHTNINFALQWLFVSVQPNPS